MNKQSGGPLCMLARPLGGLLVYVLLQVHWRCILVRGQRGLGGLVVSDLVFESELLLVCLLVVDSQLEVDVSIPVFLVGVDVVLLEPLYLRFCLHHLLNMILFLLKLLSFLRCKPFRELRGTRDLLSHSTTVVSSQWSRDFRARYHLALRCCVLGRAH